MILASFLLALSGCGVKKGVINAQDKYAIDYRLNADNHYTFFTEKGSKSSEYTWYVLADDGKVIDKAGRQKENHFSYQGSLAGVRKIKCLVQDSTGKKTFSLDVSDLRNRKIYKTEAIGPPEDYVIQIRNKISNDKHVDIDDVLSGYVWGKSIRIPVDWKFPNTEDRSPAFRINGFWFLDTVFEAYEKTQDKKYSRIILEYMLDWARQNPTFTDKSEWPWHDDATANRLLRMSYFYYRFKDSLNLEEQRLITDSLRIQAERLALGSFYTKKHNHGMHQDLALLAYALLIEPDTELKKAYLMTSISRTAEYLHYVYTPDGVHKEHSPAYARHILCELLSLQDMVQGICPGFVADTKHISAGAFDFLTQLTKPDDAWPSIGDSVESKNNRDILAALNLGKVVFKENAVYPGGGYAVMRSSRDNRPDDTWVLFMASTHSSTHKHGDDLGFLLYHKGDLITEAGNRDYNYADPMSAWVYSGYAHNVLLVNDKPFPVKVGKNGFQSIYPEALETGIVDYNMNGNEKWVTGQQKRFKNVTQYRTLRYNKADSTVMVEDLLDASEPLKATLLMHIAENVTVKQAADGWNLFRGNALVAKVSVTGASSLDAVTETEGTYPYHTWLFGKGNPDPGRGSLLMIHADMQKGKRKINTVIHLK